MKYKVSASRSDYVTKRVETKEEAVELATEYVLGGYTSVTVSNDLYDDGEDEAW